MRKKQWNDRQLAGMHYWRAQQISKGSQRRTVSEEMKALGAAIKAREEIEEDRRFAEEIEEVWAELFE